MEKLVLIFHVLTALSIIGLILLQQGKGAEAGASFGAGASQTVFGSQGSGNFFSRLTAIMATVFFVTSFGLAILAKQASEANVDADLPEIPAAVEQQGPASDLPEMESDVPQVESEAAGEVPSVGEIPAESGEAVDDVPQAEGEEEPQQ
ncbi:MULTISPECIES: preprotein translocase subunit SecG [Microbulbifer]|uniref:preprotein translocase subunit SecG n=1 Tax=Microbulbifer TaxID=48073 RepID=UPI001E31F9D3|nr:MULTISPECIES: preprotein translocase subunit SecG [Microbulbifer]UHQ56577.1 preprotein translocase subunit SecG [Microbulbifer sp. YPW16]